MAMTLQKIAPGFNNVGGLLTFRLLSPPLFKRIRMPLKTSWHEYELRQDYSIGYSTPIGLPWVEWQIGGLSDDELSLLQSFGPEVTIYTFSRTAHGWGNYNSVMKLEELGANDNWQFNVDKNMYKFEHRQLELIA